MVISMIISYVIHLIILHGNGKVEAKNYDLTCSTSICNYAIVDPFGQSMSQCILLLGNLFWKMAYAYEKMMFLLVISCNLKG